MTTTNEPTTATVPTGLTTLVSIFIGPHTTAAIVPMPDLGIHRLDLYGSDGHSQAIHLQGTPAQRRAVLQSLANAAQDAADNLEASGA